MFIQNFKILDEEALEKSLTKYLIGEKEKKRTIKGNDKYEDVDSFIHNTSGHTQCLYQISNPWSSSSWEIFDTNFPMHFPKVRDGQKR